MLVRQRIAAAPAALARGATKSFSSSASSSSSSRFFEKTRPSPSQLLSKQRSTFARRAYATEAPVQTPAAPKKKRFRFLRWTYRLTLLGLLGGTGYLGYRIYLLRHPEEQIEPDPSKKTLVILGMSPFLLCNLIVF